MSAVARLRRFLGALGEAPHPLRFLVSRALYHSGIAPGFTMTRGGIRYRFWPSSLSMSLWADPAYASWDRDVVRAIVRPGDTVVDVGANVGFVSLEAARAAGAGGRVVAYEPQGRLCRYLRGNAALNAPLRVDVREAAVGEAEGSVRISDTIVDDQNRVVDEGGVEVPVVTLDADAPSGPIRLLKIDVEGFEASVLRGGARTLERTSWVYVENAPEHLERYGRPPGEVLGMLESAGFELWIRVSADRYRRLAGGEVPQACVNVLGLRPGAVPAPSPASLEQLVRASRAGLETA